MNKKLYDDNGYINIDYILSLGCTFNFILGGRGTGKTFTSLKYAVENDITFMFMRKTQSTIDLISKPAFSPFKALNLTLGWNITSKPLNKYNSGFYRQIHDIEKNEWTIDGDPIGYTCALSTISHLRGFDASDVKLLIYDEFVGERQEMPIRNEGDAFLNAYETIDRNRQLQGFQALKVLCLANANKLDNALFMRLGLVETAVSMYHSGSDTYIDRDKSIALIMLKDSPISLKKAKTALYKLTDKDSDFNKMALDNVFAQEDYSMVQPQRLVEYTPLVSVGEVTIYRHKHKHNQYYCTSHSSGAVKDSFSSGEIDIKKFQRKYVYLVSAYFSQRIYFEKYLDQIVLERYLKLR